MDCLMGEEFGCGITAIDHMEQISCRDAPLIKQAQSIDKHLQIRLTLGLES